MKEVQRFNSLVSGRREVLDNELLQSEEQAKKESFMEFQKQKLKQFWKEQDEQALFSKKEFRNQKLALDPKLTKTKVQTNGQTWHGFDLPSQETAASKNVSLTEEGLIEPLVASKRESKKRPRQQKTRSNS